MLLSATRYKYNLHSFDFFFINIYMKNCKLLQEIYFLVLIHNDLFLGLCSAICRK